MKIAFAILIGAVTALIGTLWLIGFVLQDKLHIMFHYQHVGFIATVLMGFMLLMLGVVIASFAAIILVFGLGALIFIDEAIITLEYKMWHRKGPMKLFKA